MRQLNILLSSSFAHTIKYCAPQIRLDPQPNHVVDGCKFEFDVVLRGERVVLLHFAIIPHATKGSDDGVNAERMQDGRRILRLLAHLVC